jgi:hypothetical protein
MEYFIHLPEFQVMIYKECQYAVLPSHIDAHFAAKPQHGLDRKERQRIANEIAEIDELIGNEETLRRCEFQFPTPTSKPIAALAKPRTNGIQCTVQDGGVGARTYVVPYKKCKSIVGKRMDGRASRRDDPRSISHRTCRGKPEFIASDFSSRDPSRDISRFEIQKRAQQAAKQELHPEMISSKQLSGN